MGAVAKIAAHTLILNKDNKDNKANKVTKLTKVTKKLNKEAAKYLTQKSR